MTSYAYDRNGNRTNSTVQGGPDIDYTYTPDNQTETVTRAGITSTYAYDGLGRNLTTTDTTTYGDHTTDTAYNGLVPVQNTDNHGTANQIPDNTGGTLQTGTTSIGDRWNLTDKLGSTIAQTTSGAAASGAVIGELSDYSDYGIQEYGTTGWDADPNYTAQPTNATHTTHQFHARTQDPQTGTWTTQDTWRGLLAQPQTLNRYNYVTNNPTTLTDYMGYWGIDWGAIGRGISDTANRVGNFFGQFVTRPSAPPAGSRWATNGAGRITAATPRRPGPWRTGYVYPTPAASPAPAPQPAPRIYLTPPPPPTYTLPFEGNMTPWDFLPALIAAGGPNPQHNSDLDNILGPIGDLAMIVGGGGRGTGAGAGIRGPKTPAGQSSGQISPPHIAKSTPVNPVRPAQIKGPSGDMLPGVPPGAVGTPAKTGKGLIYPIEPGFPGINPRATHIRVMDPTTGQFPKPNGYVNYLNEVGQVVNPYTGKTLIDKADPLWHIELGK